MTKLLSRVAAVVLGVTATGRDATSSETGRLQQRVVAYRQNGSTEDGLFVLHQPVQITALDYALMGADNSCARIRAEAHGVDPQDRERFTEYRWYAIDPRGGLEHQRFGNSHGTGDITESALLDVPRPEFQVSPAEVAWHHLRVRELKAAGVEQPERMQTMTAERVNEPWRRIR